MLALKKPSGGLSLRTEPITRDFDAFLWQTENPLLITKYPWNAT